MSRECVKCGVPKPHTEFYAHPTRRDGLRPTCKKCDATRMKAWYAGSKDKCNARSAAWYAANREAARSKRAEYRQENKPLFAEFMSRRRAQERRRTPWYDADLVKSIYTLAAIYRDAGFECEVDHIVPLRSKRVCGLHVQDNLAVLPKQENRKKSNRHWPDA